jgi:hypothetical protein
MDNATGEDLSWFWKEWFMENYKLDQAIISVKYKDDNEKNGAIITIANLEQMAMPVTIAYETINGNRNTIKLPVEIWNNTHVFRVTIPTTEKLSKVVIDPEKVFPDINFDNNSWKIN